MFSNIKQKFKNMSIRNKFATMFISLMVALMVLILLAFNTILTNSAITKTKQNIQDECGLIGDHLSTMYSNLITLSNIAAKDINRIYQETEVERTDEISFISIKNDIFTALDYDKRCFPDTASIVFMDVRDNLVYAGMAKSPDTGRIKSELISNIQKSGPPSCQVFPMKIRMYFTDGSGEQVLTIGKRIISMQTGKNIGYLFVNVRESTVSASFPDHSWGDYYVVDESERIVSSKDKSVLEEPVKADLLGKVNQYKNSSFEFVADSGRQLVITKFIPQLKWAIVNQIPINDLTKDIRVTSNFIILIGVAGIIVIVIFIFILSERITKPIRKLTKAAHRIQTGDFTVRCQVLSKDEVGMLSEVFNEMIVKIGDLLEGIKSEQKKKREFELALIQEQIKPHFLYNTLELIYVLCKTDKSKEGAETTRALADYYRTSLSNGKEIVPIRDEIKNIENYLYIQMERYSDIIDFKIQVDPQINNCNILKMTLQPLVENAIYHGLKEKGTGGSILITGQLKEENVILEVSDDGIGMDEETLSLLLGKEAQNSRKHFGLQSVDERIKLYFGENYGIMVHSQKNAGTRITVSIPKNMGEVS